MKNKGFWGFLTGSFASSAGILFGINGPPVVYYTTRVCSGKKQCRSTLYGIFSVEGLLRTATYAITGLMIAESFFFAAAMSPFMFLGILAGSKIHLKVNEKTFQLAVAAIVLVAGMLILLR